jgi:hypothetical protein
MAQMAVAGSRNQDIRLCALDLTSRLLQKDFVGEITCIAEFVRDRIRYVRDINYCETIQSPDVTLRVAAGDCDDKAMLVCSLLMSIGNQCRFIAVDQGHGYCHVWTQVLFNDKWINVETTEPVPVGQPSRWLKKGDKFMTWPVIANDR